MSLLVLARANSSYYYLRHEMVCLSFEMVCLSAHHDDDGLSRRGVF
jgi:hypothetical protein